MALKGALVAVLLCSEKFFTKLEIVGFGFKLPIGFGFKFFVTFESKLPVRFVFKVLVGFEFKFSAYKYNSYCYVLCMEKYSVRQRERE